MSKKIHKSFSVFHFLVYWILTISAVVVIGLCFYYHELNIALCVFTGIFAAIILTILPLEEIDVYSDKLVIRRRYFFSIFSRKKEIEFYKVKNIQFGYYHNFGSAFLKTLLTMRGPEDTNSIRVINIDNSTTVYDVHTYELELKTVEKKLMTKSEYLKIMERNEKVNPEKVQSANKKNLI